MSKQILALALIAALAPTGEDFNPEAVNEGVWLTEAHLNNIEGALSANATAAETAATALTAANERADGLQTELATAAETITTANTRIQELEAEVATLKKSPAAEFSSTSKDKDEAPVGGAATEAQDPFGAFADEMLGLPKAKA